MKNEKFPWKTTKIQINTARYWTERAQFVGTTSICNRNFAFFSLAVTAAHNKTIFWLQKMAEQQYLVTHTEQRQLNWSYLTRKIAPQNAYMKFATIFQFFDGLHRFRDAHRFSCKMQNFKILRTSIVFGCESHSLSPLKKQIQKKNVSKRTHALETRDIQSTIQSKLRLDASARLRLQMSCELGHNFNEINAQKSVEIRFRLNLPFDGSHAYSDLQQKKNVRTKNFLQTDRVFFLCVQSIRHWRIEYAVES